MLRRWQIESRGTSIGHSADLATPQVGSMRPVIQYFQASQKPRIVCVRSLSFKCQVSQTKLDSGLYPTCKLSVGDLRQDYLRLQHFMIPNEFMRAQ